MLSRIKIARIAGNVKRYHTSELIKEEKVGQHTFNMLNILMILTDRQIGAGLMMAVVAHDMGEYHTGDIPSPAKRASPEFRAKCNELEDKAMREAHVGFFPQLSNWEYKLLKFADSLDGLMKCLDELSMGNTTVLWIAQNYASYLLSMEDLGPAMTSLAEEALVELSKYDREL